MTWNCLKVHDCIQQWLYAAFELLEARRRRRAGSGKDHLSVHGLGVTAVGHDALTAANYRTSRSSSSPLVLSPCFLDRNNVPCVRPTYFCVADSLKTGLIVVSLIWTLLGPRSQNVLCTAYRVIILANRKSSPFSKSFKDIYGSFLKLSYIIYYYLINFF